MTDPLTRRGVADYASAKRGSENPSGEWEERLKDPLETWVPGPEDMIREIKILGGFFFFFFFFFFLLTIFIVDARRARQ